ncbi:MAG TPA: ankyrin repeat domain-containing protein [Pseudonocardiaceae bacterium]|nr:ankyrin repeat domain-containing protein [Pseudonocardiaceae bacterium]
MNSDQRPDGADGGALRALFAAIVARDLIEITGQLRSAPDLATRRLDDADGYFLAAIHHHIGGGDTALHVAAAAHTPEVAELLVAQGAQVRARNRRGAEPLHYAADGRPGDPTWDPAGQRDVIALLIRAGAFPDALNKSGVAPLHRAVRTRSSSGVGALIANGADPRMRNKSGSTPLHLAVQNTGKSDSGSDAAKHEQRLIIALLLQSGASPTDVDATGKTVAAAATGDRIRELLHNG